MKKKLAIIGCIVTLLLLSSTSIVLAKDLNNLSSWHSFSTMPNDSEEVEKDIND
jgi:hypothetical protein